MNDKIEKIIMAVVIIILTGVLFCEIITYVRKKVWVKEYIRISKEIEKLGKEVDKIEELEKNKTIYNELASDLRSKQRSSISDILIELTMVFYHNSFEKTEGYYELEAKIEKTSRYVIELITFLEQIGVFNSPEQEEAYEMVLNRIRVFQKAYIKILNNCDSIDKEDIVNTIEKMNKIEIKEWEDIYKIFEDVTNNPDN